MPVFNHKKLEEAFMTALTSPETVSDDDAEKWHRDVQIAERIFTVIGKEFKPILFSSMDKNQTKIEALGDPDVLVLLEGTPFLRVL